MSRLTLRAALLAVLACFALTGCNLDSSEYTYASPVDPAVSRTPGVITVAAGSAVTILPYISHEEIEGSSVRPIRDVRPDDPTVARTSFTTHELAVDDLNNEHGVIVFGVHEGTTTLRLLEDGKESGSIRIDVVAQNP